MTDCDLTGAALNRADVSGADLSRVLLGNARLSTTTMDGTKLTGALLAGTDLCDLDASSLCVAKRLRHMSPSYIDARTVMRSYAHPGLKSLMTACGVPELFSEYMTDCARALGEPLLTSMLQSTFISYGGPDEQFARRLYESLRRNGVVVYFFPETARLGERISSEVYRGIQGHDRVLLVCSRASLRRPGVLHEIRETLDREARDGGASYLLPIMLDDYVVKEWQRVEPELAEQLRRRVVGDFRKARRGGAAYEAALLRLLDALKKKRVA